MKKKVREEKLEFRIPTKKCPYCRTKFGKDFIWKVKKNSPNVVYAEAESREYCDEP
jgi:hypothetical protein